MSRIARLTVAAALATSAFAMVPGAEAQQQIICRGNRYIYTGDMIIQYPYFYVC